VEILLITEGLALCTNWRVLSVSWKGGVVIWSSACRKCGTEEETSVHILGECEALASLRHVYLGSFYLDL